MNSQIKRFVVIYIQPGLTAINPSFGTILTEACAICLTKHSAVLILTKLNLKA
jgi:hypothetical protein